jgi:hypothetical protein
MDKSNEFASQLHQDITSGPYQGNVSDWISSWHIKSSKHTKDNTTEAIVTQFAQESNDYVCEYALSSPDGPDSYNGTEISGSYTDGAVPIVKISLARAGVRLAAWLNLIYTGKTGF